MSERRSERNPDAEGPSAALARNGSGSLRGPAAEVEPVSAELAARPFVGSAERLRVPGAPHDADPQGDDEPRELSEAGRLPGRRLEKIFEQMTELIREGRFDDVRTRLEELAVRYPKDLLFLRQVAEFHLETGDRVGAIGSLFLLARRFFESHNLAGLRGALQQILDVDPDNRRAFRLLGLLDRRPDTDHGAEHR